MIGADRKTALIVGGFVVFIAGLTVLVLVFLGTLTRWLEHREPVLVHISDASGLRHGAVVQLAGVEVGSVSDIDLAPAGAGGAQVKLSIKRDALRRLHPDATVILATAGLLGDKLVQLEPGHAPGELARGVVLEGRVPPSPSQVIAQAEHTIEEVDRLTKRAEQVVTPELAANLDHAASSLRSFAEASQSGPGLLHELAYGRKLKRQTARSAAELARASQALAHAAASTNQIVAHVRSSQGTLGGLVYDPMVYQNLREITGNVRRSVLLRTLVRFALKHEEGPPPAKVRQIHEVDPFGPTPLTPLR